MYQHHFSENDLERILQKGIPWEIIETQLNNFMTGFPFIDLVAPATVEEGIIHLTESQALGHAGKYEAMQGGLQSLKFVPASGAASRMFKSLFEYMKRDGDLTVEAPDPPVAELVSGLGQMALEKDLEDALWHRGLDIGKLIEEGEVREILEGLLGEEGLNYGQLPKGLIKFHKYPDEERTPTEEHMVEGAVYCRKENGEVCLHFTISPEHREPFTALVNKVRQKYEKRFGVRYETEFSLQRESTDTIAVDQENQPFRDADGNILFRPGGHGALLANLNDLEADLIFIKNIDNVCPDRMKSVTYLYKKALAGILLQTREKIFGYLNQLEEGPPAQLDEIEQFLEQDLNLRLPEGDKKLKGKEKAELLYRKLNRPIRVCGMVRNEGEPGGGPFWTRNRDGSVSLQIVESAQIDFGNASQARIAQSATHFNPVDLVIATKDYRGKPFDLNLFTDPDTGLISEKSSDGRTLKAQELPGLWNGSMSDWNTLFVEVPIETFTPVKTVNDLLRPEHLA
jgi:hypothetical protein